MHMCQSIDIAEYYSWKFLFEPFPFSAGEIVGRWCMLQSSHLTVQEMKAEAMNFDVIQLSVVCSNHGLCVCAMAGAHCELQPEKSP